MVSTSIIFSHNDVFLPDIYAELRLLHQKLNKESSLRQKLERKMNSEIKLLRESVSLFGGQLEDLERSQSATTDNHTLQTRIVPGRCSAL